MLAKGLDLIKRVEEEETPMEIRHHQFARITMDPEKCFGKPCIRGLRMPVASILAYLSGGMKIEEILKQWPELEQDDIHQALGFAALVVEGGRLA